MPASLRFRLRFFAGHVGLSATLVGLSVALTLGVWYPGVLAGSEGVWPVLLLLVLVDVCLGPLLTLVVANPAKPHRELWRDLAVIGVVQAGALFYGMYSAHVARPLFVVFDVNRFDTVTARDLKYDGYELVAPGLRVAAPGLLGRPSWVYAEPPPDQSERTRIMAETLNGGPEFKDLPRLFRRWPHNTEAVRAALHPLDKLRGADYEAALAEIQQRGFAPIDIGYLSLRGREREAIVLIRRSDLDILGARLRSE